MVQKNLVGKIQTVTGAIDGNSAGITMVHEHILDDLKSFFMEPTTDEEKQLARATISLENLYLVNLHPFSNLDNLFMKDMPLAVTEVGLFKSRGGNTIVEVTTDNAMGRNPQGLSEIARLSGLNIVMGTGIYKVFPYLKEISAKSEREMAEGFVREITTGVGDTGLKAGIIGEIGCSKPLEEAERKVLRSCALAQRQSGAAIYIHPGPADEVALEIAHILREAGADLTRVIIGHVDILDFKEETCLKLMDEGCYIGYDNFGNEGFFQLPHENKYCEPNDVRRINDIVKWTQKGYLKQVLVSQDVGTKERLTRYGGTGYAHILRDTVPIMRVKGLSEAQIRTLLVENPQRVLTLAQPS